MIEPSLAALIVVEQVNHDLVVVFGDGEGGLSALPAVGALGEAGPIVLLGAVGVEDLGLKAIGSAST